MSAGAPLCHVVGEPSRLWMMDTVSPSASVDTASASSVARSPTAQRHAECGSNGRSKCAMTARRRTISRCLSQAYAVPACCRLQSVDSTVVWSLVLEQRLRRTASKQNSEGLWYCSKFTPKRFVKHSSFFCLLFDSLADWDVQVGAFTPLGNRVLLLPYLMQSPLQSV